MDFLSLLADSGGRESIDKLRNNLNLDAGKADTLVNAVAPALMRGLQKQAAGSGGLESLSRALQTGGHQRYLDEPDLVGSAEAVADGNRILGHVFGSKDVSRNVAAKAASSTGLDADLIKQALPMLAGLAMGALSKKSNGGQSVSSVMPALLGNASATDDDFGLDDVLSLAKKLF